MYNLHKCIMEADKNNTPPGTSNIHLGKTSILLDRINILPGKNIHQGKIIIKITHNQEHKANRRRINKRIDLNTFSMLSEYVLELT